MRVTFQGGGPADGEREMRRPLPDTIPASERTESEWEPGSDASSAPAPRVGIYHKRTWTAGGNPDYYAAYVPVYVWEGWSASSGETE